MRRMLTTGGVAANQFEHRSQPRQDRQVAHLPVFRVLRTDAALATGQIDIAPRSDAFKLKSS
jgi:hypothetical protein